jgi:hypothetical protein
MVHVRTKQETSMTRISTFAVATLAAIAATSYASTDASAHFSGGGGSFAAGSFSPGAGHISTSGGYAHLPVAASGIARSSVIARIPKSGGHSIPTISKIAQFPRMPLPPPPPKPPTNPNNNNPKSGPGPVVVGVVPVDIPADVPVGVATGDVAGVASGAVGADSQTAQTAQSGSNCNCLTKQYLDDGSLLFRDICSKEAVLVTQAELKAQARNAAR